MEKARGPTGALGGECLERVPRGDHRGEQPGGQDTGPAPPARPGVPIPPQNVFADDETEGEEKRGGGEHVGGEHIRLPGMVHDGEGIPVRGDVFHPCINEARASCQHRRRGQQQLFEPANHSFPPPTRRCRARILLQAAVIASAVSEAPVRLRMPRWRAKSPPRLFPANCPSQASRGK